MNRHMQQTLALAGVAQAAYLVHQLARHGNVSPENFATCAGSLFVISPHTTEEVYGKAARLNLGLQVLREIFQGAGDFLKTPDVTRYLLSLLHLESKLKKNPAMLDAISHGLEEIERQFPGDKAADPEVIGRLSEIYQRTLSTLRFRVQVKGEMEFLKSEAIADKIRAMLLAGVRSAVLWRQLGGRRWHLLLYRKRISSDIIKLLSHLY